MMKILKKNDIVVHCSIDLSYFNKHSEIYRSYSTDSKWIRGEANTCILVYKIFYAAEDQDSDDHFIQYERQLELQCIVEDIENDANEVIKIKAMMNISLGSFLEKHSLSFYHLLDFHPISFSDVNTHRERDRLKRLKEMKPFEGKTENEKKTEKMFLQSSLKISQFVEKRSIGD